MQLLPGEASEEERLRRAKDLLERAEASNDRSAAPLRARLLEKEGRSSRAVEILGSACREGGVSACDAYRSGVEASSYPPLNQATLAANCRRGRAWACAALPDPRAALRACLLDGDQCGDWDESLVEAIAGHGSNATGRAASLVSPSSEKLRQQCSGGDGMACTLVGLTRAASSSDASSGEPPAVWFERGCEDGDPLGCDRRAYRLETEGADASEILPLYRKACEQGVGVACRRQIIHRGADNFLTDASSGDVWRLHRRVCQRDVYPPICRDHEPADWLALRHHPEHAIDPGSAMLGTSMIFHDRGCRAGYKYGCWNWSTSLMQWTGRVHRAEAWTRVTDWLQRACELDHISACAELGEHSLQIGAGNPATLKRGEAALDKACRHRNFEACMTLGRALQEGGDLPADPDKAASVFHGACQAGHQPACHPSESSETLDLSLD